MACLATEEQVKLAINMLNKTKQNVANEYKHRNQTNNLNNSTQEKKAKDTRNLWKKNNSREGRPVMHVDQKNI